MATARPHLPAKAKMVYQCQDASLRSPLPLAILSSPPLLAFPPIKAQGKASQLGDRKEEPQKTRKPSGGRRGYWGLPLSPRGSASDLEHYTDASDLHSQTDCQRHIWDRALHPAKDPEPESNQVTATQPNGDNPDTCNGGNQAQPNTEPAKIRSPVTLHIKNHNPQLARKR